MEKKARDESGEFPWPAFILASFVVLVAATGSVFEWTFSKPVFGIIGSDSWLYRPILGLFVFAGFPAAAFLWSKGIKGANEASELANKLDGYD